MAPVGIPTNDRHIPTGTPTPMIVGTYPLWVWVWVGSQIPMGIPTLLPRNRISIPAVGIGHVSINHKLDSNRTTTTIIRDVYYMPDLDENLLSISYLAEFNLEVIFGHDTCRILDGNQVVGKGYK